MPSFTALHYLVMNVLSLRSAFCHAVPHDNTAKFNQMPMKSPACVYHKSLQIVIYIYITNVLLRIELLLLYVQSLLL